MQVLDPNALDALRGLPSEGDGDLLIELIDLFLADAPQRLALIREAIAHADWAALNARAHSLKGSCGSLGAVPMADLCDRLERVAGGGGGAAAELLFRELEGQYALVREALEHERGAR
jgi:HPt (histidine-containing phosphotransfer) domain-containing protein